MIEVKKFEAEWCGPCRMLKPTFQKLEQKFNEGVNFTYINVDEHQELATQYGVRGIPTVVFEKDGKEVQRFTGVQSEMAYTNAINEWKN
jgi:thioredoxin 1